MRVGFIIQECVVCWTCYRFEWANMVEEAGASLAELLCVLKRKRDMKSLFENSGGRHREPESRSCVKVGEEKHVSGNMVNMELGTSVLNGALKLFSK